tara:strand:- start:2061 stop:2720 length:660 start_codon:yes stop_codon:yes gene_type:complete
MLRDVYLHGKLAQTYGAGPHQLDANTPALVTLGLCHLLPGFKKDIREGSYHFSRGENTYNNWLTADAIRNNMKLGAAQECHIIPEIAGADRSTFKTVIGVVILAVATAGAAGVFGGAAAASGGAAFGSSAGIALGITWGNIAAIGLGLTVSGISGSLAATPGNDPMNSESAAENPSFLFNGAVNVQQQGGPVPLVFGRTMTGSTVVSSGIRVEQTQAFN